MYSQSNARTRRRVVGTLMWVGRGLQTDPFPLSRFGGRKWKRKRKLATSSGEYPKINNVYSAGFGSDNTNCITLGRVFPCLEVDRLVESVVTEIDVLKFRKIIGSNRARVSQPPLCDTWAKAVVVRRTWKNAAIQKTRVDRNRTTRYYNSHRDHKLQYYYTIVRASVLVIRNFVWLSFSFCKQAIYKS